MLKSPPSQLNLICCLTLTLPIEKLIILSHLTNFIIHRLDRRLTTLRIPLVIVSPIQVLSQDLQVFRLSVHSPNMINKKS